MIRQREIRKAGLLRERHSKTSPKTGPARPAASERSTSRSGADKTGGVAAICLISYCTYPVTRIHILSHMGQTGQRCKLPVSCKDLPRYSRKSVLNTPDNGRICHDFPAKACLIPWYGGILQDSLCLYAGKLAQDINRKVYRVSASYPILLQLSHGKFTKNH